MGLRVTYTLPQQIAIMKAPEKVERNCGSKRINRKGLRLTGCNAGYVIDAPVGLTIATPGHVVWRAIHETTGAAILVRKKGPQSWARVFFSYWIRAEDEPIYTAWCSMLGRCYNTSNGNYHVYGARGICVDELSWIPGGKQIEPKPGGISGSAEERRTGFANFRDHCLLTWKAKYGKDSVPHYSADNMAPQLSRSQDEGNYNKTSVFLSWYDHLVVTGVYRAETRAFEENMDRALAKDRT